MSIISAEKYIKATPAGTKDLLFEECSARASVCQKLSRLFFERGYSEIITPAIEYFDVFSGKGGFPQESMYKITDLGGRLLVLRPDMTMPIARVAATRLKDAPLPLRMSYTASVYRAIPGLRGHSNEVLQSGIELIGAGGMRADMEILTAGLDALSISGAADFRLEIGHSVFFQKAADALGLCSEQLYELKSNIESKNFSALSELLAALPETPQREFIKKMPMLSGGEEIIASAYPLAESFAEAELLYIKKIYANLCSLGYKDKITVDFGLVQSNRYYTGIIFRGYISGSGSQVLSGGRYDMLLEEFGKPMPGAGFAVETDILTAAALTSGDAKKARAPEVIIFGKDGFEAIAQTYFEKLIKLGKPCELCLCETYEDALQYANSKGTRLEVIGE